MKKYTYTTFILSVFTLVVFTSCSRNFLEVEVSGTKEPRTSEEFRELLDNTGVFAQKQVVTYLMSDQLEDHVHDGKLDDWTGLSTAFEDKNTFLFAKDIVAIGESDGEWDAFYRQIFYTNLVLEGVSKSEDDDIETLNLVVAEAKLHRAYAYFNLVNIYATHYNPASASADLGVPIREGISLFDSDLTRVSVEAVYQYIIEDITSSIDALQDTQPLALSFRPSKAAAYALLAKVYMYQSDYEKALINIQKALDLYDSLRDINFDKIEVFTQPASFTERYWPSVADDSQVVWHKSVIIDPVFKKSYGELFEDNDLRKQWIAYIPDVFKDDDNGFDAVEAYLLVAQNGAESGTEGIYTPDMYLIRAECNARLGNIQAANNDLNALRINRYESGEYTDVNITDEDDLLVFIKEERLREFPGSSERVFDIKRYNLFDGDNISVTHNLNGETITIAPNSDLWAQPIARLYKEFNSEIELNPRQLK